MRKLFFVALLSVLSFNDALAVWIGDEYANTAKAYGIKGPVKTFKSRTREGLVELNFDEKGRLTQGEVQGKSRCTITYDEKGNIKEKKHVDFSLKCKDCDVLIRETDKMFEEAKKNGEMLVMAETMDGDPYRKCKNNPELVKQQVRQLVTYSYDNQDRLVKETSYEANNNYWTYTIHYNYDEQGNLVDVTHVRKSVDMNYVSKLDSFSYENGLKMSDTYWNYVYNDKKQVVKKTHKTDSTRAVLYTYHDNGKLKSKIDGVRCQDTLLCNSNGDTLKLVQSGYFCYKNPDGSSEHKINMRYDRMVVEYGKKNLKLSKKLFANNNVIYEEMYDKYGRCVKAVFKDGYMELVYDKKQKTITERFMHNGITEFEKIYDKNRVCISSVVYKPNGEVVESDVNEVDKYGNVTKSEHSYRKIKRMSKSEYTYYE